MENAKNTFYVALRNRLATINPERTVVVRGVVRPGILVEENEQVSVLAPPNVFVLRWTQMAVDNYLPAPLAKIGCEIVYVTDGNADNAGMDRGRLLTAMDAELKQMLIPNCAKKVSYAVVPAVTMLSHVFWSDAEYGPMTKSAENLERLQRVATVVVYSVEEPGE